MLDLLKSKVPYGDDFYFYKHKKLNYIISSHSQNFDYNPDMSIFITLMLMKLRRISLNLMIILSKLIL